MKVQHLHLEGRGVERIVGAELLVGHEVVVDYQNYRVTAVEGDNVHLERTSKMVRTNDLSDFDRPEAPTPTKSQDCGFEATLDLMSANARYRMALQAICDLNPSTSDAYKIAYRAMNEKEGRP